MFYTSFLYPSWIGCGGRLDAEEDGEIVSPGWPGVYEPERNCTWIIQPQEAGVFYVATNNSYGIT